MTKARLSRYLHDLVRVERYRLLRPFRHHFAEHTLFAFERHAVARGVAIGLFFGILTPVAQIVFALIASVIMRANIAVAAGSTLITNPFTFPVIYYFAYRVGSFATGRDAAVADGVTASEQAATQALEVTDWIPTLIEWASSVGPPLVLGMLTLALAASLTGYLSVHAIWQLFVRTER